VRAFAVQTTRRYRQIVDCFEEVARETLGGPRTVADICAALTVNQRTLARAMRTVRGTTPSQYLHGLALAEARAALLDSRTRSVRQAALRCGFRELGRFAADYRAVFGENPSETLRRTAAGADDASGVATSKPSPQYQRHAVFRSQS
jgi:AraC family transcriptional regulator, ethanolamine operon transcriptional activator